MMGSNITGCGIRPLHGKRPMGSVQRKGEPLRLHCKSSEFLFRIFETCSFNISARNPIDHAYHPFAGFPGKLSFPVGNLVEETQYRLIISPCKLQTISVLFCQISSLETLHQKGNNNGSGYGIYPEIVAMPVCFHDSFCIPY